MKRRTYIDSDGIERVTEPWWALIVMVTLGVAALVAMLAMGALYQ